MQYLLYFLIVTFVLVVLSILNDQKQLKLNKKQLLEEWNSLPETDISSEKLVSLQEYYRSIQEVRLDIDDITWNDLDLDEIFLKMNNTQSAIGEEYLYAMLRKPCFSKNELLERNRLMEFFQKDADSRVKLQLCLKQIGKLRSISVYEYISRLENEKPGSNIPHYLMALGLILSIGMIFIDPSIGAIGSAFFFCFNIFRYFAVKAKIERFLTVFSYLLRLLSNVNQISNQNIPEIKSYIDSLQKDAELFRGFKKGSGILVSNSGTGSLADAILDYIRMLFHVDLFKYNSMLSIFQKNREALDRIFKNIGFLDSCLAASSFRNRLPLYCLPELSKTLPPKLSVQGLYHPLLKEPVHNSISENRSVLITGSNASGKSTFIKTLAINALLSQTIYTSVSNEYKANYFTIFSSMALRDSIFKNESYYIVEIKSLKRIMDNADNQIPTMVLIDEVLRGTNTLERIAASSRILLSLSKKNTLCFAATHDIELTHILENYYSNYHFQERIVENQILFDYKLYKGRAMSKNAIKLLALLGYTSDIINNAEKAAETFLAEGEWEKIR